MENNPNDNKMILIRAGLILTALLILLLLFMLKSCDKTAVPEPVEGPTTVPELVEGTEPVEGPEPVKGPGSAAPTTSAREVTTDAAKDPATQPPATTARPTVPVTTPATTPAAPTVPATPAPTLPPTTAHGHSYSAWVSKEATCTEQGVKTYRCSCGSSYTEAIPALGHAWHEESVLLKAAWDEKVKVKDAWDEKVKVKDAWDEKVKVKDAWDETVVVKAAWDEQVLVKEATPAWDEQVLVREAWTEYRSECHEFCDECGFDFDAHAYEMGWTQPNPNGAHLQPWVTKEALDFQDAHITGHMLAGGSSASYSKWITVPIEHPAEYTTVHHEAIPAQYQTVHHEAETKTVHHEAEYKTVHHEAEYKTVHHEAEYKTIHHAAEYGKQSTCTRCGMKK